MYGGHFRNVYIGKIISVEISGERVNAILIILYWCIQYPQNTTGLIKN